MRVLNSIFSLPVNGLPMVFLPIQSHNSMMDDLLEVKIDVVRAYERL